MRSLRTSSNNMRWLPSNGLVPHYARHYVLMIPPSNSLTSLGTKTQFSQRITYTMSSRLHSICDTQPHAACEKTQTQARHPRNRHNPCLAPSFGTTHPSHALCRGKATIGETVGLEDTAHVTRGRDPCHMSIDLHWVMLGEGVCMVLVWLW